MVSTFSRVFPNMYTMWMNICTWLLMSSTSNSLVESMLVVGGLGDFKLHKRRQIVELSKVKFKWEDFKYCKTMWQSRSRKKKFQY